MIKVWVFLAQRDGEAVGPFVFSSKPSKDVIDKALLDFYEDEDLESINKEVFRRQLTEEEVIYVGQQT